MRTRVAERSRREIVIRSTAKPGEGTSLYFVKFISQKGEGQDWMPLETEGVITAASPTLAAEEAVENFRMQMPGLIERWSPITVYQADSVTSWSYRSLLEAR